MIGKGLRFKVLMRDGFRCRYCGADSSSTVLHVDHVLPRAAGGGNELSNLVAACAACNLGKSARIIEKAPAAATRVSPPLITRRIKQERVHSINLYSVKKLGLANERNQVIYTDCSYCGRDEWHCVPKKWLTQKNDRRRVFRPSSYCCSSEADAAALLGAAL